MKGMNVVSKGLLLSTGLLVSMSVAAGGITRLQPTTIAKRVVDDVVLAKFSPDAKSLAYGTHVPQPDSEMLLTEVKRIPMSGGKPFVMLTTRETKEVGGDWGAHMARIDWTSSFELIAQVYNGDDGSRDYVLEASRTGSLRHTDHLEGESDTAIKADPGVQALVPHWKSDVLLQALKSKIDFPGHGVLTQKLYANEDANIWWLDTGTGRARPILEERPGEPLELMSGFSFADHVLFTARRGARLQTYLLGADGELREIQPLRAEATADKSIYETAVHSSSGGIENRGCSQEACWALFWTDFDSERVATIARLDRKGNVELIVPLPGLRDIDISPDRRFLAAIVDREGKGTLKVYRIVDF